MMRIVFTEGLPYMEPELWPVGPTWSIVHTYRWFWGDYELLPDEFGEVVHLHQDLTKAETTYVIAARGRDANGEYALLVRVLSRRDLNPFLYITES